MAITPELLKIFNDDIERRLEQHRIKQRALDREKTVLDEDLDILLRLKKEMVGPNEV